METTSIFYTPRHVEPEAALSEASRRRLGLLDWIVMLFNPAARQPQRIVDLRLFFHPLWFVGAQMTFARPGTSPRIEYRFVVVDGFFGVANRVIGIPEGADGQAPSADVVQARISGERAQAAALEYLHRTTDLRYKKVPEIEVLELEHVYKPYFAVRCDRGGKEYFVTVDAESGMRNYFLDIKVRDLAFASAET